MFRSPIRSPMYSMPCTSLICEAKKSPQCTYYDPLNYGCPSSNSPPRNNDLPPFEKKFHTNCPYNLLVKFT